MSIPRSEIVRFIGLLAQHRNIKVTVNESLKGAVYVGIGAFLGGLLAGPRGLAIGGAISGVCAGLAGAGKYKSVIAAITEDLSEEDRGELADSVGEIVQRVGPGAVVGGAALLNLVLRDGAIEGAVVDFMRQFFQDKGIPLSF